MRYRLSDAPFANATGRGVTIAILDSGIHAEHPHLAGAEFAEGRSLAAESNDTIDRIGHGTAVAAAIHEKAPDARLMPVKLFHRQLSTNAELLAQAIDWAASHGAQIINLSLGTTNEAHADRLAKSVEAATRTGVAIVAARETAGRRWLPGSLPGALGVVSGDAGARDEIEVRRSDEGAIYVLASIYPRPIPDVPPERNLSGVSFAVANTTGFLARLLEAGRSMADVAPESL